MKTKTCLLSVLTLVALSSTVFGWGSDSSAYQGALFNGDSTKFFDTAHSGGPHFLSVGAGVEQRKRSLKDSHYSEDVEINTFSGILGIDLAKWLTIYGSAGEADTSGTRLTDNSNPEWLVGGTLRMMDYMVLEPWNGIDQYWVGVDLNSFYRNTKIEDNWSSDDLSEVFASLTLSFYSRPDRAGLWDRIGFYVGPAISTLSLGDLSEDQMFGFVGGLQINPTPNLGIRLHGQKFDDVGMGADLIFHF